MESSLIKNKEYSHLSEPQKMIYLGETFFPNSSINTVCVTNELGDHNNIDILIKTILSVVSENPGLHLKIDIIKGVPYQYIDDNYDFEIDIIDFRTIDGEGKESLWLKSQINRSFKLVESHLFNIQLYYSYDSSLKLMITTHHIISDAWSHQSLSTQIFEKYKLLINNNTDIYVPKYSYLDYIKSENDYLKSKRFKQSGDYWRSKFNSYTSLPIFIKNKSIRASAAAKRFQNNFDEQVQVKIINICNKNKISFSTFFLSCLLVCLNILNGSKKHFLGTLSYNRLGKREKNAVGMFVNTLPLIFDIEKSLSFSDIVACVESELAGSMKHQRYPLRLITNDDELKNFNIAENLDIIYSYQNVILPYDYTYHFSNLSSYPILFRPTRRGDGGEFFLDIDYQVGCFSENEIKRISETYQNVIKSIDYDIEKTINFNPIKKEDSHEGTLQIKKVDHNLNQTLHSIFEKKSLEFSECKAISFEDTSLTYYELNRRANYLASLLIEYGAGREMPVVLLLDRSLEMMVAILAVLKSGSCYLPLSPEQPLRRSEKIISLSGTSIVLYNNNIGEELSSVVKKIDLRNIVFPQIDIPNLNIDVKPENLAYIIYTSGSTGEPKGVMIEHKSVINRLLWMQKSYPLTETDVVMQKTPYTFDVSVWELFGWYLNGSRLHFLSPGAEKEPVTIVKEIKKEDISIIHFVPSMLNLFLEYIDRFGSVYDITSIRRVNCSGEALLTDHVTRFKAVIGNYVSSELFNLYGPTEATVEVSLFDCLKNDNNFVPIGKPIDNVELYILNEHGKVLPAGSPGELFIGGICLARGYFNNQELTAEKFKNNSVLGIRLYSTGDLATFLDDGNIKYLGRIDNQVKIRGNRVELGEVENCLLSFKGVIDVAVTAPVDENGNAYLGAYIVADREIFHDELRHFIQKELPSYMIPAFFEQMAEFPLTSTGKLDRKALPEAKRNVPKGKKYHAPINDREEEICQIWEDVLKKERIGRHDNFFEIGGDSLSLIQVLFPLQKKYDLSLQDLFEFQTIETLSQHIHKRNSKKIEFKGDTYKDIIKQRKCIDKIREYNSSITDLPVLDKITFSHLLITGATGFLGAYLVKEYLENSNIHLYLIIRGNSVEEAENRLKAKLSFYFGVAFYNQYSDRITVIAGDLSRDNLGIEISTYKELSCTIEAVVHCAANVKHFGDRNEIYNINVKGTKNILDFCNTKYLKRIFFVSTVSIGLNGVDPGWIYHFTESDVVETDGRGNVYIDSKILAEEAVRLEIPKLGGQILRIGNMVNDLETGIFQENKNDNAFYSLMMEYKERGTAPNVELPFIDLSFVNETARAIKLLSMFDLDGTYHLFNSNTVTIQEMCMSQGIKNIDFKDFLSSLTYGDSLLTHGYYLSNTDLLGFVPYNDFTNYILKHLGFTWGSIGQKEIDFLWENWLA